MRVQARSAPRRATRSRHSLARGAWLAAVLFWGLAGATTACELSRSPNTAMPETVSAQWPGDGISRAWYDGPTTRYPHGVLGDTIEGTELHVVTAGCDVAQMVLPRALVFEDTAPRLIDLTGNGRPEIIVVQSHARLGAQLAIYAVSDRDQVDQIAETPFIGRANRWLAPIGAADLDKDGAIEIAYIDRPHLARTLRVWRFLPNETGGGVLEEVVTRAGLTNHRIGDPTIPGGLRQCQGRVQMITADAAWARVIATELTDDSTLLSQDLGPWSQGALNRALSSC